MLNKLIESVEIQDAINKGHVYICMCEDGNWFKIQYYVTRLRAVSLLLLNPC